MKLTKEMLVQPVKTPEAMKKLLGIAIGGQAHHLQAVAADLAAQYLWTADFDGEIDEATVTASAAGAAGESMTVDILKNGVSILTSTTALTAAGAKYASLAIDPDKKHFVQGDVFTCTRDYTAGGGPTPIANTKVVINPTLKGL